MLPIPGGLRFEGTGGVVTSPSGGVQTDIRFPDAPKLIPENPIPLSALANPDTGGFTFDFSGQIDPNNFVDRDSVTSISDIGGGLVRVQSFARRPNTGETVDLYGMSIASYNGSYPVVNQIGNDRFDIAATFVGTATGNWRAITTVTSGNFTNLRLFYLTNIVIQYYGVAQYSSLSAARAALPGEPFVESLASATSRPEWLLTIQQGTTDIDPLNTSQVFFERSNRIRL
jgi:hypothetical protein